VCCRNCKQPKNVVVVVDKEDGNIREKEKACNTQKKSDAKCDDFEIEIQKTDESSDNAECCKRHTNDERKRPPFHKN